MGYARHKFSERKPVIKVTTGGRTQEHFQKDCDINFIMAKYKKTGVVEHVRKTRAMYGDFTEFMDQAVNMDKVAKAQQAFEALPATLRNKFSNDPRKMMEFIHDKRNFDECVELGIFDKPKAPEANPILDELKKVAENTAPKKKKAPESADD